MSLSGCLSVFVCDSDAFFHIPETKNKTRKSSIYKSIIQCICFVFSILLIRFFFFFFFFETCQESIILIEFLQRSEKEKENLLHHHRDDHDDPFSSPSSSMKNNHHEIFMIMIMATMNCFWVCLSDWLTMKKIYFHIRLNDWNHHHHNHFHYRYWTLMMYVPNSSMIIFSVLFVHL